MKTEDLWEMLGMLENEQDAFQVLTRLFSHYEQRRNSAAPDAEEFFNALRSILAQVDSCNVNRR